LLELFVLRDVVLDLEAVLEDNFEAFNDLDDVIILLDRQISLLLELA